MITGTLSRYFGLQFFAAVMAVFIGIFALVTLVDSLNCFDAAAGPRMRPL